MKKESEQISQSKTNLRKAIKKVKRLKNSIIKSSDF